MSRPLFLVLVLLAAAFGFLAVLIADVCDQQQVDCFTFGPDPPNPYPGYCCTGGLALFRRNNASHPT